MGVCSDCKNAKLMYLRSRTGILGCWNEYLFCGSLAWKRDFPQKPACPSSCFLGSQYIPRNGCNSSFGHWLGAGRDGRSTRVSLSCKIPWKTDASTLQSIQDMWFPPKIILCEFMRHWECCRQAHGFNLPNRDCSGVRTLSKFLNVFVNFILFQIAQIDMK